MDSNGKMIPIGKQGGSLSIIHFALLRFSDEKNTWKFVKDTVLCWVQHQKLYIVKKIYGFLVFGE